MTILTPKNWDAFQHYKNRAPAWIKLHRGILDDYAFSRLPLASKALAPMLWLLASEFEGGHITASVDEIAFRLHMTAEEVGAAIKPLIDSGFFVASETLAECKQDACLEREIEEEESKREREIVVATAPPPAKRSKRVQKRANLPLPDLYQLSEGAWAYARTKGLTDTEIRREFERFKNAARATDRRCVDWESAWRNWVLKALEFLGRAPADTEPIDVSGFYAEAESDELRAWDEFKRRENGRGCPRDSRGGWLVPSQWPPGREQGKAA